MLLLNSNGAGEFRKGMKVIFHCGVDTLANVLGWGRTVRREWGVPVTFLFIIHYNVSKWASVCEDVCGAIFGNVRNAKRFGIGLAKKNKSGDDKEPSQK